MQGDLFTGPNGTDPGPSRGRASVDRHAGPRLQRRRWSKRAVTWDERAPANPGLAALVEAVVTESRVTSEMAAADLGCGSGQLTLPIARRASQVIAVDVSPAKIGLLSENAARSGLRNVSGRIAALETLRLPEGSLDLVVSSYALHHLSDPEKRRLVLAALTWLRPGGRLVIGDLMLGRGRDARDRAIIAEKARVFLRRGPAGWWRLVKNVWRFSLRTTECPLSMREWVELLEVSGFEHVRARGVVSEAAVVSGVRP